VAEADEFKEMSYLLEHGFIVPSDRQGVSDFLVAIVSRKALAAGFYLIFIFTLTRG